ncbi:MAG: PepSY domain-containing protein [Rhodobacteraceae bacterium]|nr:PepSY domain-containing protein [Paracoccaceae bacterium]
MKSGYVLIVASALLGAPAIAEVSTQSIIDDLNAKGFNRIEIERGLSQVKVEASNGSQELEVIYDRATGEILKQETERLRAGEDNKRAGVVVRDRARDFLDDDDMRHRDRNRDRNRSGNGWDDDDDDDRYDDDDDDRRSGRGSDDSGSRSGSDDDDDDDDDRSGRDSDDRDDDSDDDRDDD